MNKTYKTVKIPKDLIKQIEEKISNSDISSVAEFITTLLKEKLSSDKTESVSLSSEEEEKVKERLKALGYMD